MQRVNYYTASWWQKLDGEDWVQHFQRYVGVEEGPWYAFYFPRFFGKQIQKKLIPTLVDPEKCGNRIEIPAQQRDPEKLDIPQYYMGIELQ